MLSVGEIRTFIDNDTTSIRKLHAKTGRNYYEGKHDILNYRMFYYDANGVLTEDKYRTNSRICHPFFTELVDQLTQHILSFDENPIKAVNTAEGLQDELDRYFNEEFWSETADLLTDVQSQGFGYMYAYKDELNRLKFQCADSMGVVEIRAKETDDGAQYVIYWYDERIKKNNKTVRKIQVWDKDQITFYVQNEKNDIELDTNEELNPRPHIVYSEKNKLFGGGLGYIPFWKLTNNRKEISGVMPIKNLIDDYDLMECGLTNNIQDFDTPLHVIKGYQGDDLNELQQNLKTKKIIGVDDSGAVEVKTIDIPFSARKTKADEDEKNIYRFGMGLNTAGLKDSNATTNIGIKMAYTLLDLKADKLERRLKAFLKSIVNTVLNEINSIHGTAYERKDVYFEFTRNILINEQENAQIDLTIAQEQQARITTLLNVMQSAPTEQVQRDICEVMEWDWEKVKDYFPKEEKPEEDTDNALKTLNEVETVE